MPASFSSHRACCATSCGRLVRTEEGGKKKKGKKERTAEKRKSLQRSLQLRSIFWLFIHFSNHFTPFCFYLHTFV